MKKHQFTIFVLAVIFSVMTITVKAQTCPGSAGCLDTSFDYDGIAAGSLGFGGNWSNKVVVQQLPPDYEPKLVVAAHAYNSSTKTDADFYILRYNSDGSIDAAFGSGGVARVAITSGADNEDARALAIQNDGKIVVVGHASIKSGKNTVNGFAITRLNPDGDLDTSFGNNGRVLFNFSSSQHASAIGVAIQSDGAIVVVGTSGSFAVVRLLPNGAFDTSFNGTGKLLIKTGGNGSGGAKAVKIQADGKIVVGGTRTPNYSDFAVVRLNTNGSLDTTFGGGTGMVFADFYGKNDSLNDIALDSAENIVAVGWTQTASGVYMYGAVRYLPNGQLDASFNGSGKFVAGSAGYHNYLQGVAIDGAGRINAAGYRRNTGTTSDQSFSILRLNPDGTFDTSFGGTGIVFTSLTGTDNASSITIQPDGKLVVAGHGNRFNLIEVARYLP